jgi:hypothetical protein
MRALEDYDKQSFFIRKFIYKNENKYTNEELLEFKYTKFQNRDRFGPSVHLLVDEIIQKRNQNLIKYWTEP